MLLGLTVNGFAMGMTYALLAVGMLLIVRAVKIINMAQGDILTSGAYITYLLTTTAGLVEIDENEKKEKEEKDKK